MDGRGFGLYPAAGHQQGAVQIGFRVFIAMISLGALAPSVAYAQAAPPGDATRDVARQYVDDGLAAQSRGDYDTAVALYTKAYEIIPHPVLLFDIAQAHRLAGHIEQAEVFYQRFLATGPSGPEAQLARDLLAEMQTRRAPPPPVEPPQPVQPSTSASAVPPSGNPRRAAPWYTDKIGDGLVIGGVAATTVAAIMYASARSDIYAANEATDDYQRASMLVERAHDRRTISVVFAVGGCSLVVAGILRYRLHDRIVDQPGVDVAVTPLGGMVTYKARF
jgi:tetratricopeptide (TPR) repeat protein